MKINWKFFSRFVASLILLLAGGCSSSSNDDVVEPSTDNPAFVIPTITNGFFLSAESRTFNNDVVESRQIYLLDSDQKILSRYRENASGEIRFDVTYEFNDAGLITSKKNLDLNGEASQTFVKTYDDQNRLTTGRSFNAQDPFLSTDYQFAESGAVSRKVVTSSLDGSAFSQTDYQ